MKLTEYQLIWATEGRGATDRAATTGPPAAASGRTTKRCSSSPAGVRAELVDQQVAVVRTEPDGLDHAGPHRQEPAGAVESRKVEAGAGIGAHGLTVVREDPIPAVHREREQRPGGRREVQRLAAALSNAW